MLEIIIHRIAGYDTPTGSPARVVVYGVVVTNLPNFTARLSWPGGATQFQQVTPVGRQWTAEFLAGPDYTLGQITCGQAVDVEIPALSYKTDQPMLVLCGVEPVCPAFKALPQSAISIGHCTATSLRVVTITASIVAQPGTVEGRIEAYNFDTEEVFSCDITWARNTTDTTGVIHVPAGRYLAQVISTNPGMCYSPTAQFTAPPCACPVPVFATPIIETLPDGSKKVTGEASVQVASGTTVGATLVLVNDIDPYDQQVGASVLAEAHNQTADFTLRGSATGVPPGSYRLRVIINPPDVCGAVVNDPFSFDLPTYNGTIAVTVTGFLWACPSISLGEPTIAPNCVNGKRHVQAHATVGVMGGSVDARLELRRDGTSTVIPLARSTGQTQPFPLDGGADVDPGNFTLAVVIENPAGCPGTTRSVSVASCDGGNGGTTTTTTTTTTTPVSLPQIPWCWLWFIGSLVLLLVGAVLLGVSFCCAQHASWIIATLVTITGGAASTVGAVVAAVLIVCVIIGAVLMFVGTVLLILCLMFCSSCRGDGLPNCAFLSAVKTILTVIGLFWGVLSFILFLAVGPYCGLGFAIGAVDIGLLLLFAEFYGYAAGCEAWPTGWPNALRFRIPDSWRIDCRKMFG